MNSQPGNSILVNSSDTQIHSSTFNSTANIPYGSENGIEHFLTTSQPTISNLANSRDTHIVNSTFSNTINVNHANDLGGNGFRLLRKAAVSSAMHDAGESFDRPKCYENTRVAVLNRLIEWMLEPRKVFMWLYGDAGAGKSAIAQSLAEWSARERCLLGSFFFSKNDPRRATHSSMVATIAYHAAIVVLQLKPLVAAAVEWDPMIVTKELAPQITSLLINPINTLILQHRVTADSLPHLIIIDGLDECSDPRIQCRILQAFSVALRDFLLPVKVLFASRPETAISSAFNSAPLQTQSARLALDSTFKPNDDIRYFLRGTFDAIKATHYLKTYIPADWPAEAHVQRLVKTASGQFIYASTVAKYLSAPSEHPVERLEIVLGLRRNDPDAELPFAALDALYRHLLSTIPKWKFKTAMMALGLRIQQRTLIISAWDFEFISAEGLSEFLSLDRGKLEVYLSELASVLHWEEHSILDSL